MFERIRKFFGKHQTGMTRSFMAVHDSRLLNWVTSYQKIDGDLKSGYVRLVQIARQLSMNNEYVIGFLENMERNVIGPDGFALQSKAPAELKREVKALWNEYNSRAGGHITLDEKMSGRELDNLILRTLIIDGEVFIRRIFDPASKFGYRYELIDSLEVDSLYNVTDTGDGGKIQMGVKLDSRGREVSFFIRESQNDCYYSGPRIEVPASEVIHIFRKYFPDQTRGYSRLAGPILNLGHLDAYKEAELVHARIQACTMAVWEWNGQGTGGVDSISEATDDQGEFVKEIKPGIFPIAPRGYSAKFLQNNSPNNQFGIFCKNLLRSVSNCLGISYNKATGDYESVNYSSLREATLEDRSTFQKVQNYLIEEWKEIEWRDFVKGIVLNGLIECRDAFEILPHKFFGRRFPWVDPAKEVAEKEKEYDLMLTDPYTELEARGIDPDELFERWADFYKRLKELNLPFMNRPALQIIEPTENETEQTNDQSGN